MASDQQLYEMKASGKRSADIARELSLSASGVRGRISRYEAKLTPPVVVPAFLQALEKRKPGTVTLPNYVSLPVLRGDMIITGDWQIPTTDWSWVETMIRFAERHLPKGRRQLAIVGDFLNMDAVSRYEQVVPLPSLEDELAIGEETIDHLLKVFDSVFFSLANHEYRLLLKFNGALTGTRFGKLLSRHVHSGRLTLTEQTSMHVVSGGAHWRLSHPRNYSRNRLIVAAQLAVKHQQNVISWHEHHVGIGRDPYNRYTIVNGGGLFDPEKMAYVSLVDSTSPVMSNGFVFMRNGCASLLTPYPTITDWGMWRVNADAAINAAAARAQRLSVPDAARA